MNRELKFEPEGRHFMLGYVFMFLSMVLIGYYGIIRPLRALAVSDSTLLPSYRGVTLGLIAILGYMLVMFAHYGIFRRPHYVRGPEWALAGFTVVALALVWWLL